MARAMIAITMLALTVGAQTVLTPVFDSSLPGNSDNSTLIIVQPSLHGDVVIYPQVTGPTGWQALPVLSLSNRPEQDNLSLMTTYCSLDVSQHLMFPNPESQIPWWLMLVGPLSSGTLTPWTPLLYSDPFFQELAYSYQNAATLSFGGGQYQFSFSNGGSAVHTEGIGAPLTGAPISGPARLGEAMAVGDFNGDGVDDLAVGAPDDIAGGLAGAGRVHIFVGLQRQGGFAGGLHPVPYVIEEPDLSVILIGENPGPEHHARFGGALAAGDLDGDGIDELVIGAPRGDGVAGEPNQGEAYVYRALEGHVLTLPLPSQPVPLNVPATDITQIRPIIERAEAQYGLRMTCGDLDNDQIDDLVVSAPLLDDSPLPSDQEVGAVYVFKGPLPAAPFVNEDETIQDAAAAPNKRFGSALAMADMDGDLSAEMLIGVPGESFPGSANAGKIAIWSWTPAGSIEDSSVLHPSPIADANLGTSLAVGDVNGDGVLDIVTGADEDVLTGGGAANGQGVALDAGVTYVFRGPTYNSGHELLTTPPTAASFDRYGSAVLVEDLNADGWDDVVVAAPGCNTDGMTAAGQAFVYFGGPFPSLDDDHRRLHLKSDSPQFQSLLGMTMVAGDFAGVGVKDLILAEPVAAGAGGVGTGRVVVYTDLLHTKDNLTRQDILNGVAPNQ